MLRKSVLLLLFVVVSSLSAQHLLLKVGGGLARQTASSRPVGAFKLGVGYEYEFNQHWSVSPALQFYAKGWKDHDRTVPVYEEDGSPMLDDEGNPVYGLMGRSTSANYLQLPVLFNYYIRTGESRYVVLSAGPYVGFGCAGKVKTKGDTEREGAEKLYYDGKTFDEPGTRRFESGVQVMAGYQFRSGLTLGVEGDFGLTRFKASGPRNLSGLIVLSYRLNP